jgi:hypothetical protein
MDLQQIIARAGGVEAIAGQLGLSKEDASSGIAALLPAVLGGVKQSSQDQGGLGAMLNMVHGLGGGGLADNVIGAQPTDIDTGNKILGQIFGSKDVSRTVAAHAAVQSGLDVSVLKKMLPIVAMLASGLMAKQAAGSESGLGGMLGSVLGGNASGGLGGLLGGGASEGQAQPAGGLGSIAAMLDANGDGNPLNDILGMAGKLTGR